MVVLLGATPALAAPAPTQQQASITLKGANVVLCNKHENGWALSKTPDKTKASIGEEVTWTITATKTSSSVPSSICVDGYVEVTNTGGANATIGNIVVNLQGLKTLKKSGTSWVSLAADMADATNGQGAASAKIVASQSSELITTGIFNDKGNYSASGGVGTFTTTSGSGTVVFTDAGGDEVFQITPQMSLSPGATTKFYFSATYNLVVAPGTSLRTEIIVTFGNAGGRGGSGASISTGVDINGNGVVNHPDEDNVRSVPTRITSTAPGVQNCNESVTLSDTFTDENGTDSTAAPTAVGTGPAWGTVSTSGSWTYKYTLLGPPGGSVTNAAYLDGATTQVNLVIGTDPLTGAPITVPFNCCIGADLAAVSTVAINTCEEDQSQPGCGTVTDTCVEQFGEQYCYCLDNPTDPLCTTTEKKYCSYTQGGYGNGGGTPSQIFLNNFTGLTIGLEDGGGPLHDATWTAGGRYALRNVLGGGGPSGALNNDTSDASSISGGTLTKQVATLALNVGFSGTVPSMPAGFGALKLVLAGSSLDGKTVSEILAAANTAIGGGGLPAGYSFSGGDEATGLNELVTLLNQSWDNCIATDWAVAHLQ